ncbi:uncharacterized protein LOC5517363 isoform X1 [Nematostella vectensis]|uniref:uncharacterized protein LOC5517363 isoform X1 n=2 Tax=Nematostella vectensis TaxID=45351 RepID=UPI00139018CD|nr:uncharacterized protein LOC5517363 isoform X1 [Nematostella vectensis]
MRCWFWGILLVFIGVSFNAVLASEIRCPSPHYFDKLHCVKSKKGHGYRPGDECEMMCKESYQMRAAPGAPAIKHNAFVSKCDQNGRWTGIEKGWPTCHDVTPPELKVPCPKSITRATDRDSDLSWVYWDEPSAVDNSKVLPEKTTIPRDLHTPMQFPVGSSAVQYTFKDGSGLTTTCSFNIVVYERMKLIKTSPKAIYIMPNRNLTLHCAAKAQKHVTYKWYKSDGPIVSSSRLTVVPGKGLVMSKLRMADSGIYRCEASIPDDIAGEESYSVHLHVTSRIVWSKWGEWGECSAEGIKSRLRHCITELGQPALGCRGPKTERTTCDNKCKELEESVTTSTPSVPLTTSPPEVKKKPAAAAQHSSKGSMFEHIVNKGFHWHSHLENITDTYTGRARIFFKSFYGRLAFGSVLGILLIASCCCCFICIGHHFEKKEKEKAKYHPLVYHDPENPPSTIDYSDLEKLDITSDAAQPKSQADDFLDSEDAKLLYDPAEESCDRKAYEKRRVIHELTPKRRKSSLAEAIQIAKSVILEEGTDKEREKRVSEKRKVINKVTSSGICKGSLLSSISQSKAVIMDEGVDKERDSWVAEKRDMIRDKTQTRRRSLADQITIAKDIIFEKEEKAKQKGRKGKITKSKSQKDQTKDKPKVLQHNSSPAVTQSRQSKESSKDTRKVDPPAQSSTTPEPNTLYRGNYSIKNRSILRQTHTLSPTLPRIDSDKALEDIGPKKEPLKFEQRGFSGSVGGGKDVDEWAKQVLDHANQGWLQDMSDDESP